ncbi:MAG TPA: efflux transporter outer membrane subunit [Burkholderiales bacterium]|nr:efflux transporter outer membrane subunit [Burkholderiales bacterium]
MRRLCSLPIFILALTGCMLGPDYKKPPIDVPDTFRFQENDAQDLANTAWWEQFQDPVLNELIGIAIQENKDVKIAAARIDQFLGEFVTIRSPLFPQANVGLSGVRERVGETPFASNTDSILKEYEAALSVSWEIDLFGSRRRETEAARANVLAGEEGRRATILTLVASVASSYINLRNLDRQLEIAKDTADSRANSLQVFKDRFEGGTVSELELAQSQSEYEASLISIPQIETLIAQQENALSILLGRNPSLINRGQELANFGLPIVPAGLPSELLARRPDLRQAEQNLIAANALIGVARAQYFPTISLTGLIGSVSSEFSDLFSGPAKAWSYGAAISLPIFTGGGIAGQVQQSEAQQQQALLQYQKSIQVAFQEVSDSLIAHRKAREQLELRGRQVKTLRNYAGLARVRYENGYTSYIEVLDAERSLFSAEVDYAQTQSAAYTSLVNLYKAMGGGWVTEAEHMAVKEPAPK